MPHQPSLPPGTPRLFGRIDRFTCECPRCGQLIQAHFDRAAGQIRRELIREGNISPALGGPARRRPRRMLTYNPLTSRLTCPQCSTVWGVGLLLYPVHHRSAPSQPRDQRPTYQQLLAMRQLAGGFFMDKSQPIKGSDSLNLAIDDECKCWLEDSQPPRLHQVANCPVHGWLDQLGAEEIVELPPKED